MKKGFTLIELLAVIVILAIIALIATPIVLNIINDSKESATFRSAEHYLDAVEQSIMKKNLNAGGSFSPNICRVQTNGNLLCDDVDTLEVEVKGEVPSSGTITFEEGKITGATLKYPNSTITQNNKGELVLGEKENSICKLIDGKSNAIGSKYQCKVKDNMEEGFEDGYYFFVLSHNDDGTTNLIMERNMHYDYTKATGVVATSSNANTWWYDDYANHSYGPVGAMIRLHNATKDWTNIPDMIMDYVDEGPVLTGEEGYGAIKTTNGLTEITKVDGTVTATYENLKARMPMYKEIYGDGKCLTALETGNLHGSCPLWLMNYLDNSSHYSTTNGAVEISGISGYWTLSSVGSPPPRYAFAVSPTGAGADEVNYDDINGVRPVITLKI